MQFSFVAAVTELKLMRQLSGGVCFAQAAEAAKSVQLKPPEAAMGSTGPFSDKLQRAADYLTKVHRTPSWEEAFRMWFSLFLVFRAGFSAALVCTGPAGTLSACRQRRRHGIRAQVSRSCPPGVVRARVTLARPCSASRARAASQLPEHGTYARSAA